MRQKINFVKNALIKKKVILLTVFFIFFFILISVQFSQAAAPTKPTNLRISSQTCRSDGKVDVTFAWDRNTSTVYSYEVWVWFGNVGGTWTSGGSTYAASLTWYGIPSNVFFQWNIHANSTGGETISDSAFFTSKNCVPPVKPTNLRISSQTCRSDGKVDVTFAWDRNTSSSYFYELWVWFGNVGGGWASGGSTYAIAYRTWYGMPSNVYFTWNIHANSTGGETISDSAFFTSQNCATCSNDCSPSGSKQCTDSTHYKTCGNYDSDSCLEWSSTSSCPSGQTCSGSGVCSGTPSTCDTSFPSGQFRACFYSGTNPDTGGYLGSQIFSISNNQMGQNWGSGAVYGTTTNRISAVFRGKIPISDAEKGDYEFTVETDDGVQVWVDGALIIDKWYDQVGTHKATKYLSWYDHQVRIRWYEADYGAKMILRWKKVIANQPDLISLVNDTGTIARGSSVTFTGSIKNNGTVSAGSSSARWKIDGNPLNSPTVNSLSAGSLQSVSSSPPWIASSGNHFIELCADINNNVSESNEGNNCIGRSFTVVEAPPIITCNCDPSDGYYKVCYYGGTNGYTSTTNCIKESTTSGTEINNDWKDGPVVGTRSDDVSGTWRGYFNFEQGNYNIDYCVDDGLKIIINDNVIFDNLAPDGSKYTGCGNVSAGNISGRTKVEVIWNEKGGYANLKVKFNKGGEPPFACPMSCPINISSGYAQGSHGALDLTCTAGATDAQPLYAISHGDVLFAGYDSLCGYQVKMKTVGSDGNTYGIRYCHMYGPPYLAVSTGDTVEPGKLVGYIDNSGGSTTASHLHLCVEKNGTGDCLQAGSTNIDPRTVIPCLPQ